LIGHVGVEPVGRFQARREIALAAVRAEVDRDDLECTVFRVFTRANTDDLTEAEVQRGEDNLLVERVALLGLVEHAARQLSAQLAFLAAAAFRDQCCGQLLACHGAPGIQQGCVQELEVFRSQFKCLPVFSSLSFALDHAWALLFWLRLVKRIVYQGTRQVQNTRTFRQES